MTYGNESYYSWNHPLKPVLSADDKAWNLAVATLNQELIEMDMIRIEGTVCSCAVCESHRRS